MKKSALLLAALIFSTVSSANAQTDIKLKEVKKLSQFCNQVNDSVVHRCKSSLIDLIVSENDPVSLLKEMCLDQQRSITGYSTISDLNSAVSGRLNCLKTAHNFFPKFKSQIKSTYLNCLKFQQELEAEGQKLVREASDNGYIMAEIKISYPNQTQKDALAICETPISDL